MDWVISKVTVKSKVCLSVLAPAPASIQFVGTTGLIRMGRDPKAFELCIGGYICNSCIWKLSQMHWLCLFTDPEISQCSSDQPWRYLSLLLVNLVKQNWKQPCHSITFETYSWHTTELVSSVYGPVILVDAVRTIKCCHGPHGRSSMEIWGTYLSAGETHCVPTGVRTMPLNLSVSLRSLICPSLWSFLPLHFLGSQCSKSHIATVNGIDNCLPPSSLPLPDSVSELLSSSSDSGLCSMWFLIINYRIMNNNSLPTGLRGIESIFSNGW